MRHQPSSSSSQQPLSRWQHALKAGAVFTATTATYLLARTAGWLPAWANGGASAEAEIENALISSISEFQAVDVSLMPIDIDTALLKKVASQRRLLQLSSVAVENPIPDQVIEVTQEYSYVLDNVFSGDYDVLHAAEAGKIALPSWLNLQYSEQSRWDSPGEALGVTIVNQIAFIADAESGLQIVDISNPLAPVLRGAVNTLGAVRQVAVQNGLAVVADNDQGIQIFNISDLSNPAPLGAYSVVSDRALGIALQNSLAFVVFDSAGLQILNISDPLAPVFVGAYNTTGKAYDVVIENNLAIIADGSAGLQILNISNPAMPILIKNYPISEARAVTIQNQIAYVAAWNAGLQIINMTDPSNPLLISQYTNTTANAQGIDVQDNFVWVTDYYSGLQVLDVRVLAQPQFLGSYAIPGVAAYDVAEQEGTLWMAYSTAGLVAVDMRGGQLVGTPTALRIGERPYIAISAWNGTSLLVEDIFRLTLDQIPRTVDNTLSDQSLFPDDKRIQTLNSDLLFIDPDESFLSLSLASLNKPIVRPWVSLTLNPVAINAARATSGFARRVFLQNQLAYVAEESSGVEIFDISVVGNPIWKGIIPTLDQSLDIAVQSDLAVIADSGTGLRLFNVSNPAAPQWLRDYPLPGPARGVFIQNQLAYVASGNAGLRIVNITDPSNPGSLGFYNTLGSAQAVVVQNDVAYVADYDNGVQIIDVSNPLNLTRLGSYVTLSSAIGIAVQGHIVFVAEDFAGLRVLDVSDPSNPLSLALYDTPEEALSVAVHSQVAFIADSISGLQIVDVRNVSNPVRLGVYDTAGLARFVAVDGPVAWIADGAAGLQALDVSQWQLKLTPGFSDVGNWRLQLTATDELGGVADDTFSIRVEGPPQLKANASIPVQFAKIGQAFSYFIPQGLFSDPNFDVIHFTAVPLNASVLPDWLSFNGLSATFGGIPQNGDQDNITVVLTATDNIAGSVNISFRLYIDHIPVISQPFPSQVAGIDRPYLFPVLPATFFEPDGDDLTISAERSNGLALPDWLSFDSAQEFFSGAPNASHAGIYRLDVIATDPYRGQVRAGFELLVETFPVVNQPIPAQLAGVGNSWVFTMQGSSFYDADGDGLTYSARRADGSGLPSWLSFNANNLVFSGQPLASELGNLTLQVTATDPYGGSAAQNFTVSLTHFPEVVVGIVSPPALREDRYFNFTVPMTTFSDLDDAVLTYSASRADDSSLPAWLSFAVNNLTFTGVPSFADIGSLALQVTATDSRGGSVAAPFELSIQPNFSPEVLNPISNQVAEVNEDFSFFVPQDTFIDRNGDVLSYRAEPEGGGSFPGWLRFDNFSVSFSGKPGRSDTGDLGDKVIRVALYARDDQSEAHTVFNLNVNGTSNLEIFLRVGVPILSVFGAMLAAYKKRALCINRYKPERYQQPSQAVIVGQPFRYEFKTPREQIHKLQVKRPASPPPRCCYRLFTTPDKWFASPRQALPGGFKLPSWLVYDPDKNELRSEGLVPEVVYAELIVQIKDDADIILEQLTLQIGPLESQALLREVVMFSDAEPEQKSGAPEQKLAQQKQKEEAAQQPTEFAAPAEAPLERRFSMSFLPEPKRRPNGESEGLAVELQVLSRPQGVGSSQ